MEKKAAGSIRFIHLSDLHFRRRYEDYGIQALLKKLPSPLKSLTDCLEKEKKQGIDFVLLTGDLSHDGTREDYSILRDALNHTLRGIPWVAVPGNHDCREAMRTEMREDGFPACGDAVYDLGGWRVITLDTGKGVAGVMERRQIRWLQSVLASPAERRSILAIHHPLVPNQEGLGTIKTDPGFPALIQKSDVAGIFCGHTHHNYAGIFAGKPYFTADSMSYILEEAGPNTYFKAAAAYNRVEFGGGSFSVQVRHLVPAPAVAACFPTDTLPTLFQTRKRGK